MKKRTQFRKTKIVATIGPACDTPETLEAMIRAGMTVARLNLSHGSYKEHRERISRIRAASERAHRQIAVMIDTRGIEIRTTQLEGGLVELISGQTFSLYTDPRPGDGRGVSVTYPGLGQEVNPGDPILLDDGAMELRVRSVQEREILCKVVVGGILRDNKGVNLPDTQLPISAIDPARSEDMVTELGFAADNDVDYIAASFVQSADDIHNMRRILRERGVEIPIIAKIENKAGVRNLEAIVLAADGIMVARGDLGVELPLADVPSTQKKIIRTTVSNGKPVITATEMLASMEFNPKPTRAEASDVANAILDGTSAVMLSGETAVGKYPVETVSTMSQLAIRAEASLREYGFLQQVALHPSNLVTAAVSESAVHMADRLNAAAIYCLTETGFTARLASKHRPECPILALTSSLKVARRLSLNWGVIPVLLQGRKSDEQTIDLGCAVARKLGMVEQGDLVVVTSGQKQEAGGTNLIQVLSLQN